MRDRITKEDLKREVGRLVDEAQTKVKDQYENVKESAKQAREKTDEYIKDNPEKSVLAGAGLGFVLGIVVAWLFSRKK